MVLSPAVFALLFCGAVICGATGVAAISGAASVVGWNPDDGGARQLARERRLLLVEVALSILLAWQVLSLFLFVATAERLHPLIAGAMCAAGTLNASPYGYPTLAIKVAVSVLCGLWLVVSRASSGAMSTGLVRFKQISVLLVLAPLAAGTLLELRFFGDLDPEVITSCCSTLFGGRAAGTGLDLVGVPVGASRAAFFTLLVMTLASGLCVLLGRGAPELFATLAVLLGVAGTVAVVTWVAPAYYELPTHHCPFCVLAGEHHYVGYPLYAALGIAAVTGVGAGVVHRLRSIDPMRSIRRVEERRLCSVSMLGFMSFTFIAVWPMVASSLRLEGY